MAWTDRAKSKGALVNPRAVLDSGAIEQLHTLLELGALVSFGLSRDGASLSCTVTYDGAWDREWFRDVAECGAWMLAAVEAIQPEAAAKPPATSGSQRSSNGAPRRGR